MSTNIFVESTNILVHKTLVPRPTLPDPTPAELEILRVLWKKGPSTVRHVVEEFGDGTGYTTVLKLLQIMKEKGLVTRDDSERSHVFTPTLPQRETQRRLVMGLLERAFEGSAQALVMQALAGRPPSRTETTELRRLLDSLEKKRP